MNLTFIEPTSLYNQCNCANATEIEKQVAQYCTGDMFNTIMIMTGISLFFFMMIFYTMARLYGQLDRAGIINLRLGMAQFSIFIMNKEKAQSMKNYPELSNLWGFVVFVFYSIVVIVCQATVLIMIWMNY